MKSPGIEDAEDDNVEDDAGGVDDDGEAEDLLRVRVGDGDQEAGQQHQVVHQQRLYTTRPKMSLLVDVTTPDVWADLV